MGFIGKLLSFGNTTKHGAKANNAVVDPGGGATKTLTHFSDAGDDSQPLPGDYVACVKIPRSGNAVATGYVDPANDQKAQPGEKRIYARDGDGVSVVEVWLKADGTAVIENTNGFFRLNPDGSVNINGTVINSAGEVTVASGESVIADSMIVDGKELKDHTHGGVETGGSSTGPNE